MTSGSITVMQRVIADARPVYVGSIPAPMAIIKHEWHVRKFSRLTLECCEKCGIIKNASNVDKPCKGAVKVETRK